MAGANMFNNSAHRCTADRAPDASLTDLEIISTVQLFQSVPAYAREPIASAARLSLEAAPKLKAIATIWLAVWPDRTWAMLAHNPDWARPRPEQLIRAYCAAHLAGIRIPVSDCFGPNFQMSSHAKS